MSHYTLALCKPCIVQAWISSSIVIRKEKKMAQVTINDEPLEAQYGDILLDVARRNASHIGFACGGRGLCHTCEVRVLEGGDALSTPNEIETESMTDMWREQGYRLACQALIMKEEPVRVISYAEQMRRLALLVVSPPEGSSMQDNANLLFNHLSLFVLHTIRRLPYTVMHTIPQFQAKPPELPEIGELFGDTLRVIQRTLLDPPVPSPGAEKEGM
jgi:ferredoxin